MQYTPTCQKRTFSSIECKNSFYFGMYVSRQIIKNYRHKTKSALIDTNNSDYTDCQEHH